MDTSMLKKISAGFVLFVVLVVAIIELTRHSSKPADIPQTPIASESTETESSVAAQVTKESFIQEVEEQRSQTREDQTNADAVAKRKAHKEQSAECRFWKLQKETGKSDKADEKIAKFCEL